VTEGQQACRPKPSIIGLVEQTGTELIVLARYMQVLSDQPLPEDVRQDHQHPPLLPAVVQGRQSLQAGLSTRGVKLIGATAHYVTADLDEGPILEQDTVRVTHAQSPDDYVSLGRDVESQVLARAIHAHIHHRTFINGTPHRRLPAEPRLLRLRAHGVNVAIVIEGRPPLLP
jgi:formyltetrahydrofolate deformylase